MSTIDLKMIMLVITNNLTYYAFTGDGRAFESIGRKLGSFADPYYNNKKEYEDFLANRKPYDVFIVSLRHNYSYTAKAII